MSGTEIRYTRYVALGDSQTEGLGDGDDSTGLRGRSSGDGRTAKRPALLPLYE